ncbi:MAG: helix-turn-helix domain-containing protein [Chloroflexota bacterium]
MNLNKAAAAMAALGNPVRLKLFKLLVAAGPDGLSISEMQAKLDGIPRSTLSHHLNKLVQVGLVPQEKDKNSKICRANYQMVGALVNYISAEYMPSETTS